MYSNLLRLVTRCRKSQDNSLGIPHCLAATLAMPKLMQRIIKFQLVSQLYHFSCTDMYEYMQAENDHLSFFSPPS